MIPLRPTLDRATHSDGILDRTASIASGGLPLTVGEDEAQTLLQRYRSGGIRCARIGVVQASDGRIHMRTSEGSEEIVAPDRNHIARLFE